MQNTDLAVDGYRIAFASILDLRAVHRLEHQIFLADAYTVFDLFVLMLMPGMSSLKVTAPDGALAGYAAVGRVFGMGRTWIMTIGIHPEHQRRGLGRWLLASCEAMVADPHIYLTVREDNERAIALYRMNGYRQVRIKPAYYSGGWAGIEMVKVRPSPA